jgi:hypothetical protein
MKQKTAIRLGLVVVALFALSTAVWMLRGGAPGTGEKGAAPVVQRAAALATAPTAGAAVALASPGRSDGSDGSDRSAATAASATPTPPAAAPQLAARPNTQPVARLTAANEGIIEPLTGGVKDRYAKNEVLDERIGEVGPDGTYERVRIVKTEMKYPLVRVIERWEVGGGRGQRAGGRVFSIQCSVFRIPESCVLSPASRHPTRDTLLPTR